MRVAHHLFKKRFSTLLNEQDILAQLHPLNLSLRQLNIFLKDGVVKSEVTNRQCFQFFKDRRLTPYTAPTSHCDQILLNVALQTKLKLSPPLFVLALDLLATSLTNQLPETTDFVLNQLLPAFQTFPPSESLQPAQLYLIQAIINLPNAAEIASKVPWQKFIIPSTKPALLEFTISLLKMILVLKETPSLPLASNTLLNFQNDSFISFWIKSKPRINLASEETQTLKFFYEQFLPVKEELAWSQKTDTSSTIELFEEYLYLANQLKIDVGLTFDDFKDIDLPLAQHLSEQNRQVFLAEDFVKGVEKYLSNAKVKPMERDFQRYYSIMHNSSAVDEELVGMLEERSLASNQKPNIIELLKFYSNSPVQPGWHMKQYLSHWSKQLWRLKTTTINQKLLMIGYLFQIDGVMKAPSVKEHSWLIDLEMMSLVNEFVLSLQTRSLSHDEKVKAFFLINTYFAREMIKPSFQETFRLYFTDYLKEQTKIVSNFQKEISDELSKRGFQFEMETLIFNSFSIDFLVSKKTVIEANGPSHYSIFLGKPKDEFLLKLRDRAYVVENRKTQLKTRRLKHYGLEVINIPYFYWNTTGAKKGDLLMDLLKGLSFREIHLLSK